MAKNPEASLLVETMAELNPGKRTESRKRFLSSDTGLRPAGPAPTGLVRHLGARPENFTAKQSEPGSALDSNPWRLDFQAKSCRANRDTNAYDRLCILHTQSKCKLRKESISY